MGTGSRKKLVLRIGLSVIGLLVLAVILVPLLVPSEKWTQLAFDRLETETGLIATAESSRLSLLPLGLRMDGLSVRDPENRPEYAGVELDLEQVVVTAQIRPLFSGRFEIDQVKLVRPHVVLTPVAAEAGEASAGTASGQAGEEAPAITLALAALSIEDGYVQLNQADRSQIVLHGLTNLSSLDVEGQRGHATAKGSMDSLVIVPAEGVRQSVRELEWELAADFNPDGKSGSLVLDRVSIPGLVAGGEASWQTAERTAAKARLDVTGDVAALAADWFRPDQIEWPEGIDPADFGDFSGDVEGELVFDGEIDPEAEPAAMAELVRFEGKLVEVGGRILGRDDLARIDADLRFAGGRLDLDPLRVVTPAGELTGRYAARPLSDDDARVELAGDVQANRAMTIARELWPKLIPLMEEGATPPDEWPGVRGAVALEVGADIPVDPEAEPRITWTARAAELTVRPIDIEADFVVTGLHATGDAENVSLREGTVTGPGMEIAPRLEVSLADGRTSVTGRIDAKTIDLDELQSRLAPPTETAMGNWFVGVAHAQQELWIPPEDMSADLRITAREVLASGHRLESVEASTSLRGQKVAVRDITAGLGTGTVKGIADVDYAQVPPVWSTRIEAGGVPAAILLAPDAPKLAGALDTSLSGVITFAGQVLTNPDAATKQLTGNLSLGAAAGLLRTEPVLGSQISQFVGQYAPNWKELAFKALDAELRIDQGQVHFDRFLVTGDTEVRAGGSVGLDGRCDYRLDIVLPASATPDVGALQPVVDYLRDDDGRFPFAVNVTGPAAKPKVQIDFDALGDRAQERGKEELEGKVDDAVKGLWDKLKGGK